MRVLATVFSVFAWVLLAGGCAPPEKPEEPFWNQELLLRIYLDGLVMIHPELTLDYRLNTPADQQNILDDIEHIERRARELHLPQDVLPADVLANLDRLMVRRLHDYNRRREFQPARADLEQYYRDHLEEFRRPPSVKGTHNLIEEGSGTEQVKPFEEVARSIQRRLFRERMQQAEAEFYQREAAAHEVEILFAENLTEVPSEESPVYRIDGRTFTYQDVLRTHSNLYGDRSSVQFFQSIVKRALQSELLFSSPEADRFRETREYRFLREAFLAQWRVYRFLNREYEETPISEEELLQFYEENKAELYRAPTEVKLIVVSLARPSEAGLNSPLPIAGATDSGENLEPVWKDFISSASPESFSFTAYEDIPGLQPTLLEEWTPVDRLGRLIEMDIRARRPGDTSPILTSKSFSLFYHVLERRDRGYLSFDEVRPTIEFSLRQARMKELREEFELNGS